MFRILVIPGIQYAGETVEQMSAREAYYDAYNRYATDLEEFGRFQRARPIPGAEAWFIARGLWKPENFPVRTLPVPPPSL